MSYIYNKNMHEICLNNNQGKAWEQFSHGYVKGFAFDQSGNLLEGEFMYKQALKHFQYDQLSQFLDQLNGNFSIVLEEQDKLILIVDSFRSYPLFYSEQENGIRVMDIGNDFIAWLGKNTKWNEEAIYELLALGYLSGCHTLLDQVNSVEAGSYVLISKEGIDTFKYVSYMPLIKKFECFPLKEQAAYKLEKGFEKIIETIKGRPILIPLSGGYDSRLVACLCKKYGLLNVTCFTYGRKDSFEVEISKKVADQLGFEWHFVEYTFDLWKSIIEGNEFKQYCLFAGNLTANPHFQDFPALSELKRLGILRPDMVVIPGHSGDLLGGSKIPVSILENREICLDRSSLCHLIYNEFYNLNTLKLSRRELLENRIISFFEDEKFVNQDSFLDNYETWFIKSKISNFLVNSMRGYEFWGMDWRLPLWDRDYENLWYSIPWKEKYYSKLYNEFMFEYYFETFGVAFQKSVNVTNTNVANYVKRILPTALSENLRKCIQSFRKLRIQENINAFDFVVQLLCENIDVNQYADVEQVKKDNINAVLAYYYINLLKE